MPKLHSNLVRRDLTIVFLLLARHSGLCQDNVGRKVCIEESKGAEKQCNKVKQYPQSNDRFVINSDD